MNLILEPLQFAFMRDALIVGGVVAIVCSILSCFLILRGWSLMGDAISHAVLPGIVLAYILGLPISLGAFATGLLCATATGYIKEHSRIKEDTIMGVVFTGLFAVGLLLFSQTPTDLHLDHVLFGNILGISLSEKTETLLLGTLVSLVVFVKRRDLLLMSFDPAQTQVIALPRKFLHYLLLSSLALAIVVSLKSVGIILVIAMLIAPGAIAYLWTDNFERMLLIATGSALISTIAGVLISYHIDGATGATIVLTQTMIFVMSLFLAPKHGVLGQSLRRSNARKSQEF